MHFICLKNTVKIFHIKGDFLLIHNILVLQCHVLIINVYLSYELET